MTGGVNSQHAWPDEGATHVPDLVYQDADLYEAEQKLTSAGPFCLPGIGRVEPFKRQGAKVERQAQLNCASTGRDRRLRERATGS